MPHGSMPSSVMLGSSLNGARAIEHGAPLFDVWVHIICAFCVALQALAPLAGMVGRTGQTCTSCAQMATYVHGLL